MPQMVRDGTGARLLNGEGVGWLGNARPASDVEHVGGGTPPCLPWVLRAWGCALDQEGGTAGTSCSPAVGHVMGADQAAWVTPSWRVTWPKTCIVTSRVGWGGARARDSTALVGRAAR